MESAADPVRDSVAPDVLVPSTLSGPPARQPRLALRGVAAGYGNKQVIHDVDLEVMPSSVVVLLGHNGAGKSTTMAAAFGLIPTRSGTILVDGRGAAAHTARRRVLTAMAYVPADNFVFPDLTVRENLSLGAVTERDVRIRRENLAFVLDSWPILAERRDQLAGTLSGGQRRMLSLGIALMSTPSLLLLDEPSLGLAPNVVDALFADLRRLADERGLAVFLIEQSVAKALAIADDAYVMQSGRIVAHEPATVLIARESLWDLF